jgi:AbiV family abortive infection protein
MSPKNLSADELLYGAMYAMEQAGLLLHDAVGLYEGGRYSSAIALAVFAREEIGRAGILQEKWREALTAGPVPADSVIEACYDHVEKLGRGQAGVALRCGPEHAETLKPLFGGDPQSEAWRKARAFVDERVKRKGRRDPQDTHEKRKRALYVEPRETGSGWNRPCETSKEEARRLLEDVGNDYGVRLGNLQTRDEELAEAASQWKECPKLPDPIWPSFP